MKSFITKVSKNKIILYIVIALIIILQAINMVKIFTFDKTGFHSDEMYSFGLSNSHHNPFLSYDKYISDTNKQYINVEKWVSGDIFKNYIEVDNNERFDYENVWYNQSYDRHPPLFYLTLHTVCSFFPESFSAYYGLSVTIICFIVAEIFLYLLAKNILKSRWLAIIPMLCYGFSVGAVDTFIYIRMYSMVTMWVIILAYVHSLISKDDKFSIKHLISAAIVVMLGALTQHEFTIVAFVFAICFCIIFLLRKQIKGLLAYGTAMLSGILLACVIFPPLLSQIFGESGKGTFDYFGTQFRYSIEYFLIRVLGLPYLSPGDLLFIKNMIIMVLLLIIIFSFPILFLFRNNSKILAIKSYIIKNFALTAKRIKNTTPQKIAVRIMKTSSVCIAMLLSGLTICAFTAYSMTFFTTGYCDRYIMITYPLFYMSVFAFINWLIGKIHFKNICKYKKQITSIIFLALLTNNLLTVECNYLFPQSNDNNISIKELSSDSNFIIFDSDEWREVCFSSEMLNIDSLYYTTYQTFEKNAQNLSDLSSDNPIYLLMMDTQSIVYKRHINALNQLLDNSCEITNENVLSTLNAKYFSKYLPTYSNPEFLGISTVFGIDYYIYKLR